MLNRDTDFMAGPASLIQRPAPLVKPRVEETIPEIAPQFLNYLQYDLGYSAETIVKYRSNLRRIEGILGNMQVCRIDALAITAFKKRLSEDGVSPARINNLIFTLRSFLRFCNDVLHIETINPSELKTVKAPIRAIEILTPDQQKTFLGEIEKDARKRHISAIRFRALVLCLRSTGCRIGELLRLNRADIDFEQREARVLGKGSKERIVYFSEEAMEALRAYLKKRCDNHEALFVALGGRHRWNRNDAKHPFRRYAKKAGITKHVTAHMWRRVFCTTLHRNGADILTIKELAGHSDIKTTMQYYIATDKTHLKVQHSKFLRF